MSADDHARRNEWEGGFAWAVARAVLFRLDAELAHDIGLGMLARVGSLPAGRRLLPRAPAPDPRLASRVFGLAWPNPLGVAAGLDKGARAVAGLAALGFSHVEVGTITPSPQPGNPRPRVFRLPSERALINRFGFNSEGAHVVGARLAAGALPCVVGINVGKNRETPLARAAGDYELALRAIGRIGDYVVVNVSSPNTPGLRDLQAARHLRPILDTVLAVERELAPEGTEPRPVLVKLAPDLADADLDAALDAAAEAGVDGFIAANTTNGRPGAVAALPLAHEAGGLSGAPLLERTVELVRRAHRRFDGRLPIVGVGGVGDADDAWRLLRAGASLVQAYTGLIYGGPTWPRRTLRALARHVAAAGLHSVADAVGADS